MSSDTRVGVAGTQSAPTEVNGLAHHAPGIDTHPEKTPDHDAKKTPEPHDDQDVEAAVKQHEHIEALQKTTTVDTVHDDVAVRVLNAYGGDRTWTAREEKQLVRKIDRRLLSIVVTTYGLQYYDKAMLAQAALFGLIDDLDLGVGMRYSLSSAIFYLGFICGAYPAIAMAQRYPIERVMFGIVCLWGLCLMTTAGCTTYQGLYAQRFFLGILESGVSPAWMLVVGGWYKKQEQAFRMGAWYCATGYVSIVAPLINYGLGHITGSLSPWRYMYIVAGLITVIWSFVILFLLPPDPTRAKRFSDRERYIAVARMRTNNSGVRNTHFKSEQLVELITDIKFWLAFSMAFLLLVVNGPVSTFTPIIISDLGFSGLESLLLVMPAGAVIGTIELMVPFVAMKFPNLRCYLVAATTSFSLLASLLLWKLPASAVGGRLFAVYTLASYGGGYAVLMSLQIANTAGYTKRSLGSSGIFVGYCLGNFLGPLVFKAEEAPHYTTGWITTVATSAAAIVLAFVYRLVCAWENQRRDKSGEMEAFEHAYEDDLTDRKNPQFRYTL
ncbi:major facilitator superfamily domain-containing protein [Pestalotiopsis sp. NC0098]|nr:major facilitator superfamily domain-containing protein [Pestalotiopsis sp. NC0098]